MNAASTLAFYLVRAPFFAEGESAQPVPAGSGPFSFVAMIFFVLVAMYLLFVLPAKSRNKQAQQLLDSIKINDRVLTTSGIIGVVHSIDRQGGEIVLRVDDSNNVKMRFSLSAIYYVYDKEAANKAKEEKEKEKDKGKKTN